MTDQVQTKPKAEKPAATVSARLIEKVGVALDARLGSVSMTVGELAALTPSATVVLDAQLNDPVELWLGDALIARGELVAVGEKFGVRLTEIAQWQD